MCAARVLVLEGCRVVEQGQLSPSLSTHVLGPSPPSTWLTAASSSTTTLVHMGAVFLIRGVGGKLKLRAESWERRTSFLPWLWHQLAETVQSLGLGKKQGVTQMDELVLLRAQQALILPLGGLGYTSALLSKV